MAANICQSFALCREITPRMNTSVLFYIFISTIILRMKRGPRQHLQCQVGTEGHKKRT